MKKIILALILTLTPLVSNAERQQIVITEGTFEPVPVAIHGFTPDAGSTNADRLLKEVVSNDLGNSGLFDVLNPNSFLEQVAPGARPNFPNWQQIGAQGLVTGAVRATGGGYEVEFRLWDVLSGQQIEGMSYTTSERGLRRVAHQIADKIYERMTGEKGYFDSRIVYVAESGAKNRRVKQLAIMDQDGANHQYLTGGKTLVLTPRFSTNDQKIAYMSYALGAPRVKVFQVNTGAETTVGNFPGMTFGPRFSPDGQRLLLAYARNGNTDIYEVNLNTGAQRQITNDPAIEVSPSYSPDGTQIAYSSDRGGSRQIYVTSAGGGAGSRISYGKGNYDQPVWSPRGDFIAFTKQGGGFSIGVIRPDGSGERIISSGGYIVESPSWAPNGRVIVFSRGGRGGDSRLYSVDITGYNERLIPTPGDASDGAWSPLLQ
jgi:TolB protein